MIGVYAHMGCMISATEAFMMDVEPFFVADAVADFTRDEHTMACEYVGKRAGRVLTTHDVVDALRRGASDADTPARGARSHA